MNTERQTTEHSRRAEARPAAPLHARRADGEARSSGLTSGEIRRIVIDILG